jgi:hypothetical protein
MDSIKVDCGLEFIYQSILRVYDRIDEKRFAKWSHDSENDVRIR